MIRLLEELVLMQKSRAARKRTRLMMVACFCTYFTKTLRLPTCGTNSFYTYRVQQMLLLPKSIPTWRNGMTSMKLAVMIFLD